MSTSASPLARRPLPRAVLVQRVEDAYGSGVSASALGEKHGVTRNIVIGIWGRGRKAGRIKVSGQISPPNICDRLPKDLAEVATKMPPGRCRMLLAMHTAEAEGVTMSDLADAYYADSPKPPQARKSCGSQVTKIRDQIAPLDWIITAGTKGSPGGRFVLARKAIPLPPAPSPEPTRYPLADALGIKVTSCMVGGSSISLARCVGLEGVSA